jgi:hypothetical protein
MAKKQPEAITGRAENGMICLNKINAPLTVPKHRGGHAGHNPTINISSSSV